MEQQHQLIFESVYKSQWHQPYLLWILSAAFLVYFLAAGHKKFDHLEPNTQRFLKRYFIFFSVITILDAWLTATPIPGLGQLPGYASAVLPLVFVLLGDFRYFLFSTLNREPAVTNKRPTQIIKAAAWTFVVPVASTVLVRLLPMHLSQNPRVLFLTYELMFFAVALLWRFVVLNRNESMLRSITGFVMVYYGLWASADLIIFFTQSDFGYFVRLVPNILYYCGLLPFIYIRRVYETNRLA